MARKRQTIGVIFGGRSVEHDVSIVTAQQIMQSFDETRYEVVPIYISRDGKWYTGDPLRDIERFKDNALITHDDVKDVILSPDVRHHGLILKPLAGRFSKSEILRLDVVFPAVHGSHGEDGTLQGLLELADIPYVGFGTTGSALTNDKILTRQLLSACEIPGLPMVTVPRSAWMNDPDSLLDHIEERFAYPVFVKPATLGSSIGVNRANDRETLRGSLDIAANFDRRVLVEPAVTDGLEINCAVMGYDTDVTVSVLEQPLSWSDFLAFEDKYLRGDEGMKSAEREIPAPIRDELTDRIQQMTREAFAAVDGRGIARIDYLVKPDTDEVYLNEINTMPGSLAFYLWQEMGMSRGEVVEKLVTLARDAHTDKRRNMYNYKTNLVDVAAGKDLSGTKGVKGTQRNGAS